MLAQKNPRWKNIFCDLYKKDKSGLVQKAFVRDMFLSFLHRSHKMFFHSEMLMHIRIFFRNFLTHKEKTKNVLPQWVQLHPWAKTPCPYNTCFIFLLYAQNYISFGNTSRWSVLHPCRGKKNCVVSLAYHIKQN